MMQFRDEKSLTHCGKSECGMPVTARDERRNNTFFVCFNEHHHSRKVCAAKRKKSGESCEICETMVPKLQIFHDECPEKKHKPKK
jgi:hypothetical protein